jgi:phosphoribosylaminoimidazole-succinocarboxamide synthase
VISDPAGARDCSKAARRSSSGCDALPIEAVVRGYLIGSGWKDYQRTGAICGIALPPGLRQADACRSRSSRRPPRRPRRARREHRVPGDGSTHRRRPRARGARAAIAIYRHAAAHARARGIIIADTKFEFGVDRDGALTLIDEVLTPDSSRFWPADTWRVGASPPSFDKQYVRDYLETLTWDKRAPGPPCLRPSSRSTAAKYAEALARLTGPATGNAATP